MKLNIGAFMVMGLALAILLAPGARAEGLETGDQLLSFSASVVGPVGESADELELDPGPGIGVAYLYQVRPFWGFGLWLDYARFEGGQTTTGAGFRDQRDSEGTELVVGARVRFVFNPASRTRGYVSVGQGYGRVELREDFVFQQGEFVDAGAVTAESSRVVHDVKIGLERDVSDRVLIRGEGSYRGIAGDLNHLAGSVGIVLRF